LLIVTCLQGNLDLNLGHQLKNKKNQRLKVQEVMKNKNKMETNPKKSIDSLKDQEIDGQNVKGGFTLINHVDGLAHYTVENATFRNAVLDHAQKNGYKNISFTNKLDGTVHTFSI
jgi:hypothetical protein